MSMRARGFVVWAVSIFVLCAAAFFLKAPAIERDVLERAQQAVKPLNPDAEVLVDGRYVAVRGIVADEAAKAKTLAAASAVEGALGPFDGLWISTASAATASNASPVALFLAEKHAQDGLTLSGSVASEADRAVVEEAAKTAVGGGIDNRIVVAEGGTPLPSDLAAGLRVLAGLDSGALLVSQGRAQLAGATSDPARAAEASALASASSGRWQVFVSGAAPAAAPMASSSRLNIVKTPDGALIASGDVSSTEARAALISEASANAGQLRVVDRLVVRDTDLPQDWDQRATVGAKALASLDWGSVSMDGARSYLNGMADSDVIGRVGDALGASYTAELTPRPSAQTGNPSRSRNETGALAKANARIAELTAQLTSLRSGAPPASNAPDTLPTDSRTVQTVLIQPEPPADEPDTRASAAACNAAGAAVLREASITFESKSAFITPAGNGVLDRLVAAVSPCVSEPALKVIVGGHTDSRGQPRDNAQLSQARAEAVKEALIARNVPPAAITAIGYGEAEPIADNDTEEGREANRRITMDWSAR